MGDDRVSKGEVLIPIMALAAMAVSAAISM